MSKIKKFLHDKSMQIGTAAVVAASAIMPFAGAAAGESGSSAVVSAITTAGDSLKGDAATVIGVAVAVGLVFFGAKLLWSKFKGMAK